MSSKVESIYPANDFKVVANEAGKGLESGLILGYDSDGELRVFGGGMIKGRPPTEKDWLMMIEEFKFSLLAGDFADY